MEFVSIILAGIALAVSITVAVIQYRQNSRIVAIEEDRRSEELAAQETADVRLTLTDRVEPEFRVRNLGPADAWDIDFSLTLVFMPGVENDGFEEQLRGEAIRPIPVMHAGDTADFSVRSGTYGPFDGYRYTLTWEDPSGFREVSGTLS